MDAPTNITPPIPKRYAMWSRVMFWVLGWGFGGGLVVVLVGALLLGLRVPGASVVAFGGVWAIVVGLEVAFVINVPLLLAANRVAKRTTTTCATAGCGREIHYDAGESTWVHTHGPGVCVTRIGSPTPVAA